MHEATIKFMVLRPVQLIYPFSWIKFKRGRTLCIRFTENDLCYAPTNHRGIVYDTLESSECKQNIYDRDHINVYWMEVIRNVVMVLNK